jgi:chemotaxis protein MotB
MIKMHATLRCFAACLIALGACACVTQATHDALQKQCDQTRADLQGQVDTLTTQRQARDAELSQLQADLSQRDQDLTSERRRAESLQAALTRVESLAESLQDRLATLEAEIASLAKDRTRLSASIEDMQSALEELRKRKAEADARVAEYRDLLSRFRALIDSGKLRIKIVDGRMIVELATDVLFESGKADLSDPGRQAILEVSAVLTQLPKRGFQVEGHTDNVPISNARFPSNWELASARALTVLREMVSAGMPPDRVSAASFGDTKPVQPNTSPEGRARNRRIEIVLVPDLSTLPGFDELEKLGNGS